MISEATVDGQGTLAVEPERTRLVEGGEGARASELERRQADHGCRCELREGMSLGELMALGSGCTAGDRYRGGWVCPVLDHVRQAARKREGAR